MNKKLLINSGYAATASATLIALLTTIAASSPNTTTRALACAGILGVFGIGSFMFALISKE